MIELFHWFTLGALSIMLGYMSFQYFFIRKKEYLYFSLYLFFTAFAFFLLVEFYDKSTAVRYFIYHASYSTIPFLSFIVFLRFMDLLLDVPARHPSLSRFLMLVSWLLVGILIIDLLLFALLDKIHLHFSLATAARALVLITGTAGSLMLLKSTGKEGWFFIAGSFVLIVGGSITTLINTHTFNIDFKEGGLLSAGLFYYRTAILIQILLFAMGISYRTRETEKRKSELEKELIKAIYEKEIEKRKAVEQTRSSIAGDLHDDIGAALSSISIYSKLASDKLNEGSGEIKPIIDRINDASRNVMDNMGDVIWSIKPGNDSMELLVDRIRSLMNEIFGMTGLHFTLHAYVEGIPRLSMVATRNIYLLVKESLNNILKHSGASQVYVQLIEVQGRLQVEVRDNGIGFDTMEVRRGNGIENMRNRVETLSGRLIIESSPGNGTILRADFGLDNIIY